MSNKVSKIVVEDVVATEEVVAEVIQSGEIVELPTDRRSALREGYEKNKKKIWIGLGVAAGLIGVTALMYRKSETDVEYIVEFEEVSEETGE